MPTEKEWQKFKEKIIGLLESQQKINETFLGAFRDNFKIWRKFLKTFFCVIFLLIIFISIEELSELVVLIWQALSEDWRIALFLAIWSLLLVIFTIFIDRKYIHKS